MARVVLTRTLRPTVLTRGALASRRWLDERGLMAATSHWYVEVSLLSSTNERSAFELSMYPNGWNVAFRHEGLISALQVTDETRISGCDDHDLIYHVRELAEVGDILAALEQLHQLAFDRRRATVVSNLPRAALVVRAWLVSL